MAINACYAVAMRMLVRREYSRLELESKLGLKEYEETEISEAIDDLIERGYQSDQRFTEAFIKMRYNQGKGPVKIRGELKQRGIQSCDLSEYNWYKLAKSIKNRKYGENIDLSYKDKSKQKRFLQSRGFELDQINEIY